MTFRLILPIAIWLFFVVLAAIVFEIVNVLKPGKIDRLAIRIVRIVWLVLLVVPVLLYALLIGLLTFASS